MKIIDTYHAFAKEMFLEAEVDDDKVIKYKKKDGEQGEMKASSAKTMPKDHPAKIEYDKMVDKGGDSEKDTGKKLGGSDFDRDGGDDEPSDMDTERPADEPEDEVPGKNAPEPGDVDQQIKDAEKELEDMKTNYNDPNHSSYGSDSLEKKMNKKQNDIDSLKSEKESPVRKSVEDILGSGYDKDKERNNDGVPVEEQDWAEEYDDIKYNVENAEDNMEETKREWQEAEAEGDEEYAAEMKENYEWEKKEYEKAKGAHDAYIKQGGEEGWLEDEDQEKYDKQQQQKAKSGSRSGGMIGSIGAREKGQGGSGMYDSIQINGKKYRPIKESKKPQSEEKDFTQLLKENYKRFSRK